jgi:dTMP kinase
MFITLEGGEGAGKTTLKNKLEQYFTKNTMAFITTKEPGGTALGIHLREILLNKEVAICPMSELLLLLADRAEHIQEVIIPALKEKKIVLCDRFHDSTIAYQGAGRELGMAFVENLCKEVTKNFMPDITLYLDIDPKIAFSRKKGALDRIEKEGMEFHMRVRQGFLQLAKEQPRRIFTLDSTKPKETLFKNALDALNL